MPKRGPRRVKAGTTSSRDFIKVLDYLGFVHIDTNGSHRQYMHKTDKRHVTVATGRRGFREGTFKAMLRQAGITRGDFAHLLDKV
ncbi:MAG: type II toxin-antitoxin system HicA family toxin [Alphaproteobacteria bacterium]|nr:type II toxin-antitoxin system HicA family toxin [Alphaproteobacteria bacterium]MDA8029584.1 type II toxin-antitoxin system HicA family toxin [Alphaproteobacteria bacterium]